MGETTQEDREAVAAFHKASFDCLINTTDEDIVNGINRAHELLCQAFARHRQAAEQRAAEQIIELRLCEAQYLILRPDVLYRFTVDPNCHACRYWDTFSKPPDIL